MNPEQIREYKLRRICNSCKMRGHWASEHNKDGTVKDGFLSLPANNAPAVSSSLTVQHGNFPSKRADLTFDSERKGQSRNNIIAFTATMSVSCIVSTKSSSSPGPLVDYGATFSAIGLSELRLLAGLSASPTVQINTKTEELAIFDYRQYGQGNHTSGARRILGSFHITAIYDSCTHFTIRHLVIEGWSQWVVLGRNISHAGEV